MTHCTALDEWAELLEREFSLEIDESRRARFGERLNRYAAKVGLSADCLLGLAKRQELPPADWANILHFATNHETHFFRHPETIEFILAHSQQMDEVRVLSVGCSTGQEAYSIGTALHGRGVRRMRIHGTDISHTCIKHAIEGVYPAHSGIPASVALEQGEGMIKFFNDFKKHFTFETHNVLSEVPINFEEPGFIVLQNVLIYYKQRTRHQILDRLSSMLAPGSFLIVGIAEDSRWQNPTMRRVPHTRVNAFQKIEVGDE